MNNPSFSAKSRNFRRPDPSGPARRPRRPPRLQDRGPGRMSRGNSPSTAVAVHPAAVSALYRSADGRLDLAAFKTKFEARQWEDQFGWWVTDLEEDPVSGRSPFFAYAAFAGPVSGGAELYVLSIAFNAGEPADVNNILLIQKSGDLARPGPVVGRGQRLRRRHPHAADGRRQLPLLPGAHAGRPARISPPVPRSSSTPHEDLEATSESCFAAANFVYNLTQDREDLVSVRLYDEPAVDEKGRTERFRFQSCFNRIFNEYLERGKTALTPAEVDEFAARFRDECMKPGAAIPAPVDR
ncbi:MAG: hypothetical protein M0C28_45005 [Candidatus Moduliflexus flocculans]|nr:hypothetical protein [Candidatus Moduliflexus flocculans]